jgi:phosphoglycerol geranylgeranyltransferase
MKMGKVEKYILEKIKDDGAILLALIDPDKDPFEKGAQLAEAAYDGGADIILVGGSVGAQGMILDKTTKMIRDRVDIPIVLFPGNVGGMTPYADATYFMFVLNSRDVYWTSTVQIQGAPVVKRLGIEPIPTAYIILEPGRAVGWISNANLIPRNRPDLAAATALAGEYMGARLIVTESGSGAPEPASPELISAVKSVLNIPYFYAGGCRTPEQARQIIKAGADGIQIGTAFEGDGQKKTRERVRAMVRAIKDTGKVKKVRKRDKIKSLVSNVHVPRIDFSKFKEFRWRRIKNNNKNHSNSS